MPVASALSRRRQEAHQELQSHCQVKFYLSAMALILIFMFKQKIHRACVSPAVQILKPVSAGYLEIRLSALYSIEPTCDITKPSPRMRQTVPSCSQQQVGAGSWSFVFRRKSIPPASACNLMSPGLPSQCLACWWLWHCGCLFFPTLVSIPPGDIPFHLYSFPRTELSNVCMGHWWRSSSHGAHTRKYKDWVIPSLPLPGFGTLERSLGLSRFLFPHHKPKMKIIS